MEAEAWLTIWGASSGSSSSPLTSRARARSNGPLLGWTINDPKQPDKHGYYDLKNGDFNFGGAMAPPQPDMPDCWMAYIDVADVDQTVAQVTAGGGTAPMPGMDIEGVGRIAAVADPSGARFALYKASQVYDDWKLDPNAVRNFGWSEVATDDVAQAKDFYATCFGWAPGAVADMGDGEYHMMNHGETPVCGMYQRPPTAPMCAWTHDVNVDDTDAIAARAVELGGQVIHNQVIPGMVHFAILSDPRGAVFGVAKGLADAG